MAKTRTLKEYRRKTRIAGRAEPNSRIAQRLEGENAEFALRLQHDESKGRPRTTKKRTAAKAGGHQAARRRGV
jgi:hypothetical protein